MPKECCAVDCFNIHEAGNGLNFYRFPKDPDRRSKWIAAVNRKDWPPTEYTVICCKHFINNKHFIRVTTSLLQTLSQQSLNLLTAP